MKSNDLHTDEIIKCFHCGNETPMKKVGEYSWGSRDIEYSEIDFTTNMSCSLARFAIRLPSGRHTAMKP